MVFESTDDKSIQQDLNTLFELEVFWMIKQTPEYDALKGPPKNSICLLESCDVEADKKIRIPPKLIGPDRATVLHTVNTLESYRKSLSTEPRSVRRNYFDFIDIVGTQARYPDISAVLDNFDKIKKFQRDEDIED